MKKFMLFAVSMLMIMSMLLTACTPETEVTPTAEIVEATTEPIEATEEVVEATEEPVAATEEPVVATEEPVVEPAIADQVIVAIGADPADLSPFTGMSMGRIAVLKTIYEYFLEPDQMGVAAVPMLAQSVEQTGDLTYVVTLFDYIYDSAGNHITAADAAWSYNQGMAAGKMRPLGNVESVTATGDYTVEFVFKTALGVGDLDKTLTECPIVSQAAYEASPDGFATTPVTTGAYTLTEYVPGSSLTFEARPDYWQTDPALRTLFSQANVQTIVFQVITEPAQHAIALETGSADISASVTADDLARFESNPDFIIFKFLDNLTQVINFNGSDGNPFTSKELRQAVAYAIDTAAICTAVLDCAPAHTIGNTNFGSYQDQWDSEAYYEFDLAAAQALMATAGIEPGTLTVRLLGQNDARTGLLAQVIQAALAELGITVEINQVEASVFNELQYDPTAFDMVIGAAAGGDFAISPWLLIYEHTRNNGSTSSFFVDDQMQSLLMTVASIDGFTVENLNAFNQYQREQLYSYGLLSYMNNVVSVSGITQLVRDTRGQLIPGAFVYSPDFNTP
jgi:ABC-type transport system substrate-binding protein